MQTENAPTVAQLPVEAPRVRFDTWGLVRIEIDGHVWVLSKEEAWALIPALKHLQHHGS